MAEGQVTIHQCWKALRGWCPLAKLIDDGCFCDLTLAGSTKPLGYLPLYTLKHLLRYDPKDVAGEANASGLTATQFGPDACCIKSSALYVYHREALARKHWATAG